MNKKPLAILYWISCYLINEISCCARSRWRWRWRKRRRSRRIFMEYESSLDINLIMSHFKCISNSVVLLEYLKYKRDLWSQLENYVSDEMWYNNLFFVRFNILIYCLLVPLWRWSKFILNYVTCNEQHKKSVIALFLSYN